MGATTFLTLHTYHQHVQVRAPLARLARQHPALREFVRFLKETEKVVPALVESSLATFTLARSRDPGADRLILVDASLWGGNWVQFSSREIATLFASDAKHPPRIFFADPRRSAVIEVTQEFFFWFLQMFRADHNSAGTSDFGELNAKIAAFCEVNLLPITGILTAYLDPLDLIVSAVDQHPFREEITQHLIAAWRRPKPRAPYEKVFPAGEEPEASNGEVPGDGTDAPQD